MTSPPFALCLCRELCRAHGAQEASALPQDPSLSSSSHHLRVRSSHVGRSASGIAGPNSPSPAGDPGPGGLHSPRTLSCLKAAPSYRRSASFVPVLHPSLIQEAARQGRAGDQWGRSESCVIIGHVTLVIANAETLSCPSLDRTAAAHLTEQSTPGPEVQTSSLGSPPWAAPAVSEITA